MRKLLLLGAALLLVSALARGQERKFVVRHFAVDPLELRAKTNPVYDNNGIPAAMIRVSLSVLDSVNFNGNIVGEPERNPGEWILFMPAGSSWIDIAVDGYERFHYEFPAEQSLQPARGYVLDLGIKVLHPMRTLVMPIYSYNLSQTSYGLMLGLCKRNGGYIKAKSDFQQNLDPTKSCDADGIVNQTIAGWFTGEANKCRLSFTAGYMRQIVAPLYLYAGGGWGKRILAWKMYTGEDKYEYVRVEPYSFAGYEVELGAILRFGPLILSAGIQTNQFKYYEANAGFGVMF